MRTTAAVQQSTRLLTRFSLSSLQDRTLLDNSRQRGGDSLTRVAYQECFHMSYVQSVPSHPSSSIPSKALCLSGSYSAPPAMQGDQEARLKVATTRTKRSRVPATTLSYNLRTIPVVLPPLLSKTQRRLNNICLRYVRLHIHIFPTYAVADVKIKILQAYLATRSAPLASNASCQNRTHCAPWDCRESHDHRFCVTDFARMLEDQSASEDSDRRDCCQDVVA